MSVLLLVGPSTEPQGSRAWRARNRVIDLHPRRHRRLILSWQGSGGFSIDASVHIQGDDRVGMDRIALLCLVCGGPMTILAFLTDPPVVAAIVLHLELPHRPPPISPARAPQAPREAWSGDFLVDQTPVFDPAQAEAVPEIVFDQSLPGDVED